MWQDIIVGICVIAAAYFVMRQWLPIGKKKSSGCGGCGSGDNSCSTKSCDTPQTPKPPKL